MKVSNTICFVALIFFGSCSTPERSDRTSSEKKVLSKEEYLHWNDGDKNLVYNKEVGNYDFSVKYIPSEVMALRESNINQTTEEHKEKLKEFSDLHYVVFKIKSNKGGDLLKSLSSSQQQYESIVNYFSFQIQQDLFLMDNGDTLLCVLANFERTYGVSPYCTIMAGFEKKSTDNNTQSELTLIYNDQVLQTGPVKLNIPAEDFAAIPQPLI